MGDTQNPAGGAGGSAGGTGAQGGDSSQGNQNNQTKPEPKVVPWESHQRALDDMHAFKNKLREAEAKLGEVESEKLKAANDYKTLFEQEKTKREEAEQKANDMSQWAINTQRTQAVRNAAEKKGLLGTALKDLELLDLKDVKVDVTARGNFHVEGAEAFVDKIKSERPHWFGSIQPPDINGGGNAGGGGAGGGNGKLSADDVVQAERDWKRNKIPKSQYVETYNRYAKQQGQINRIQEMPTDRTKT